MTIRNCTVITILFFIMTHGCASRQCIQRQEHETTSRSKDTSEIESQDSSVADDYIDNQISECMKKSGNRYLSMTESELKEFYNAFLELLQTRDEFVKELETASNTGAIFAEYEDVDSIFLSVDFDTENNIFQIEKSENPQFVGELNRNGKTINLYIVDGDKSFLESKKCISIFEFKLDWFYVSPLTYTKYMSLRIGFEKAECAYPPQEFEGLAGWLYPPENEHVISFRKENINRPTEFFDKPTLQQSKWHPYNIETKPLAEFCHELFTWPFGVESANNER